MTFVSLHTHSHGSFLDASAKPGELAKRAKELGMPALALTDHGNLYNAIPFYLACEKEGVKPILGVEFNFVDDCQESRDMKQRHVKHIVLLAENRAGWRNIVQLATESNQEENFFYKPRIDFKMLERHSEGVIALTACPGGVVAAHLYDRRDEAGEVMERKSTIRAEAVVRRLLTVFDEDHLFLEVQDAGLPLYKEINAGLRKIASKYGLRTVCALNVHYVNQGESEAHHALQSMQHSYGGLSASNFDPAEFYLKGRDELDELDFTEAEKDLTVEIAERCNVDLGLGESRLPSYPHVPDEMTNRQYFRQLIKEGAKRRGVDKMPNVDEYRARVKLECDDIEAMGFEDYFLIVHDVVAWTKEQGILVGPGRGSAGGSLVSYLLGITDIDPLPYGLIWERFLNRGRKSLPDIDTDVPRSRRGEVLAYIRERFGEENVAQLATFNQLAARAVLKDVFRVYEVPFDTANEITACVPLKNADHGKITLDEAIRVTPQLQQYEEQYKAYFAIARALEGCYKSLGTHAAAVVISNTPFADGDYPLCRSADNKSLVFSWDMDAVDRLGLLKLDILGLSTLDVIQDAFDFVRERHGVPLSFDTIPLDDDATFELLSTGKTVGVFQLEKQLGKTWSKQLFPRTVEEISDLVSIIRPGPMESGMHNIYKGVKAGDHGTSYPSDRLKPLLDPTYGALLYQEQVIYICQQVAGMNLADADMVRKAMGKKKPEEMAKWKEAFVSGCAEHGTGEDTANEIWGWIEKFAGYGFNKSHGVGYALLAYYTTYIKANYPVEFFAACLKNAQFAQDTADEVNKFVNDARLFGLAIIPPRLSVGNADFGPVSDTEIAFGLGSLKGVGEKAIGPVVRAHQKMDGDDFDSYLVSALENKVNRRVMEALIQAGALDDFGTSRTQMLARYELYMGLTPKEREALPHVADDWVEAVGYIADEDREDANKALLKEHNLRLSNKRRRETLRELLGTFKSSDPYDGDTEKAGWEQHYLGISLTVDETGIYRSRNTVSEVVNFQSEGMRVEIACKLDAIRVVRTKRGKNPGQEMAFVTVSDATGQADNFVVFPQPFAKHKNLLKVGNILRVRGTISDRGGVNVTVLERLR